MKKLLLLFLLTLTAPALAQVMGEPAFRIYRGNSEAKTLSLPPADALQPVTVSLFYSAGGRLVPAQLQPTIAHVGQVVQVNFTSTDAYPEVGFCEVSVAGRVRWNFPVLTTKQAQLASTGPVPPPAPSDAAYLDLYSQLLTYLF